MFDVNFVYEASNVKDAINKLVENENSEIISGGTDVLIRVRKERDAKKGLVSIHNLKELKGISLEDDGSIKIGSGTSFNDIICNEIIKKYIPSLGDAVEKIGSPQIREIATIGGNICNGATSADSATTMMILEADIYLEGPNGERVVNIKDFYIGPGKTIKERCEVCKYFKIKKINYENYFGNYFKYGKRKSLEIATIGCAILLKLNQNKKNIDDVKIAYGVASPIPTRAKTAENFIKGKQIDENNLLENFANEVMKDMHPRDSWRASADFRKQLIYEIAKRQLVFAIRKAGGEINYYV